MNLGLRCGWRGSERPERTFGQSDSLDAIGSCVLTWCSLLSEDAATPLAVTPTTLPQEEK